MIEKKYKYSEIFGNTFQGEGHYTGRPTAWIRLWGCNFRCDGFGQLDPGDPATHVLDYQTIDLSSIKRMEDLPVFKRGCDSAYSWHPKFAHLAHTGTAVEICDSIQETMKSDFNPHGAFLHPNSKQWCHLAITGGEPLMNQRAIVDILSEFDGRMNTPKYVTIETNGTQALRDVLTNYINKDTTFTQEIFWSVSPKLAASGESWDDAIKPHVVAQYASMPSTTGQFKFVSDGTDHSWQQVEQAMAVYREAGVDWPVWIMPVGADIQGQTAIAAKVSDAAICRGYNVAARVHTYVYGNVIGK